MHRLATILYLPLLSATAADLAAQDFTDTFSVPGATVPGWTQEVGTWAVNANGRLALSPVARVWSYITVNGVTATNCVLDMDAYYVASGVQFAGLTARYASANSTLMCKIQENTTASQDFDRAFLYNRGGASGSTWADTTTNVTGHAGCRMIVCGTEFWMKMDFDNDGTYDQTIGPRTITTLTGPGKVGLNAYGVSEIDDFEYFSSVLKPAAGATPKIGTTFNMEFHTNSTSLIPFRMALSGGNDGFPIGSRPIPLNVDPIFDLSLLLTGPLGLAGVTDNNGLGKPGLVIPNDNSLVGFTVFGAAITLDGTMPMGIGDISNEIAIKFVQ